MNKQPKQGSTPTKAPKESKKDSDKKSGKSAAAAVDKKSNKPWLEKGVIKHNEMQKSKDKKLDVNGEAKIDNVGGALSARKSAKNEEGK